MSGVLTGRLVPPGSAPIVDGRGRVDVSWGDFFQKLADRDANLVPRIETIEAALDAVEADVVTINDRLAVVGAYASANVPAGSAVSLTSGLPIDVTALALPAGDWDVWGNLAVVPSLTTTITSFQGWGSDTSATFPTAPDDANGGMRAALQIALPVGLVQILSLGQRRFTLGLGATVYLSAYAAFSGGTCDAYCTLAARRWS